MASLHLLVAAVLLIQAFTLFTTSTLGHHLMSTNETIAAVVAQLDKARLEIVAKIADVQAQLDAANVPAEVVDLSALQAAAQAFDDIVPDPVVEAPVDAPVE